MLDKSVCDVSIGEETVDARSPNFAFLSLMNVGPMGPALARGGKLTLARCVWYPGPGLMEKACFHSCQSHLLRATPRLHTHGKDHRLSISHTPRPSPAPRQFVFVILWTSLGGNYEQNNTNNTRRCVFIAPQRCVWVFICRRYYAGPSEWLGHRGLDCKLDFYAHIVLVYACQENVWFVAHRGFIHAGPEGGKGLSFKLVRVACGAVDWDVWGRFDRWLNCV